MAIDVLVVVGTKERRKGQKDRRTERGREGGNVNSLLTVLPTSYMHAVS